MSGAPLSSGYYEFLGKKKKKNNLLVLVLVFPVVFMSVSFTCYCRIMIPGGGAD